MSEGASGVTSQIRHTSQGSVHLDALRGAAALLVFVNHTRALYFSSFLQTNPVLRVPATAQIGARISTETDGELKVASAAVIVFFVLSGYLVGGGVLRAMSANRWRWSDYLTKRLVRLLTVLVPAIVLGASLDYLGLRLFGSGSIYGAPRNADIVVAADLVQRLKLSVLVGNLLFLQNISVPLAGTNVSLWSLANEFWYYLAFPLGVIACFANFKLWLRCVALFSAAVILWFVGFKVAILFPVWMMGAFIPFIPNRMSSRPTKIAAVLTLTLLIGAILLMRIKHMHAVPADYVIGVLTSALLYTFIRQSAPAKHGLYKLISEFFSRISYTLYLFHLPLAVFLCGLTNTPWHPQSRSFYSLALFGLRDLLVLGIVYVLWTLFEAKTDRVRNFIFRLE